MNKRFIVKLGFKKLPVSKKIEMARFIVTAMTGNANFPNPSPALPVITTDANNLEAAELAAEGGGKAQTAAMHAKEEVLVRDMLALVNYVEVIANNNPANAEAIITSAGMDIKADPSHGPTSFQVQQTANAGEVKLRTAFVRNVIYHWQMSTDQVNWMEFDATVKGSVTKSGLNSAVKYFFRVAIKNAFGMGPWSDPVSIIIS